jgi:hypothetical protein
VDSRRNDRRVSGTGKTAVCHRPQGDDEVLGTPIEDAVDDETGASEEPCFLASELPPVPDWARQPPKPKGQRGLFDDL